MRQVLQTETERTPLLSASHRVIEKPKPPSWLDIPKKDQLALLTLVRLAEPITETSMHAYMFAMVRRFDGSLSDGDVASRAGLLAASFMAAQAVTGVLWGHLADKAWMGRKRVLLIGISGSLASIVGFGFSRTFYWALFFRCFGGIMNGNVSVMRTMISEIIDDKKYQAKAFLLLPITFNVGTIVGPLIGGLLQDPVAQYPSVFGPGSILGGKSGVSWLRQYLFALPNVIMAVFTFLTAVFAFFGMNETHQDRKHLPDFGVRTWRATRRAFLRPVCGHHYTKSERVSTSPILSVESEVSACENRMRTSTKQLPYRRIFTRNVVLTLLTHCLLATHVGSFNTLWFLFLSAPRNAGSHRPSGFAGGLGLPSSSTGIGISIIGVLGLTLQFSVFGSITHRVGVLSTFRTAALLFPVVYMLTPLLTILPTRSAAPLPADGWCLWAGMTGILFLQVTGRTFALPLMLVLTNNSSPHPSVLGSLHGIASSVSSGAYSIGPIVSSWLFGKGLDMRFVALAWWLLAAESLCVLVTSRLIHEGDGHEIKMDGEDDEQDNDGEDRHCNR